MQNVIPTYLDSKGLLKKNKYLLLSDVYASLTTAKFPVHVYENLNPNRNKAFNIVEH